MRWMRSTKAIDSASCRWATMSLSDQPSGLGASTSVQGNPSRSIRSTRGVEPITAFAAGSMDTRGVLPRTPINRTARRSVRPVTRSTWCVSQPGSGAFEDRGDALADADAHGDQRVLRLPLVQLERTRAAQAGARGTERMAQG